MIQEDSAGLSFSPLDMIPNGILILRLDFTILYWNRCMEEWTGLSRDTVTGTNILDRYPTLNSPTVVARIRQLFEGGPAVIFSPLFHPHLIPCPLRSGGLRVEKISCIPYYLAQEKCALVVIEDVTDLTNQVKAYRQMKKVAEEQLDDLKKTRDAIYLANKKLNLLNSITRHDIMNKLTVLLGYLELDSEIAPGSQDCGRYLGIELETAEAIRSQIQFTRYYQDIGIRSALWQNIEELVRTVLPSLDLKGIHMDIALKGLEIYADPLLQKVFYNLIENSLRHGEHISTIRIFASDDTRDGDLGIIYEDDGAGVPDEAKEKIFKREYYKNTGFGLFLSSEILAITNIRIRETGTAGIGARFEILVPRSAFRWVAPANNQV